MSSLLTEYSALCTRAYAHQRWPSLSFSDKTAQELLRILQLKPRINLDNENEKNYVKKCRWFDQQCLSFFAQFPRALCIDLFPGLNTRFHRVSLGSDWPQFSWIDIDTPTLAELKQKIYPYIDHFDMIATDNLNHSLIELLSMYPTTPLLIVAENINRPVTIEALEELASLVKSYSTPNRNFKIVSKIITKNKLFFCHNKEHYFSYESY